jgi:FAD binding domain
MALVEIPGRSKEQRTAAAAVIATLAARYGNRLATSQALRQQHGHTTTWIENQPPDAVVFPQSVEDVQEIVRLCAAHRVPVIGFGQGTSLEGQVNAPRGGICLDFRDMNRVLAVHAEDLDCVIEPGITRKQLNENLRDTGLFFPIDLGADASLGGMAATRASGTNAVRYRRRIAVLSPSRLKVSSTPGVACVKRVPPRRLPPPSSRRLPYCSVKRNNMWVISFFLGGPAIDAWPSYPAVIMREGSRRISPSRGIAR